eukprot:scaffold18_cov401-Prasinococcus_capsulatus_cf.AAC.10
MRSDRVRGLSADGDCTCSVGFSRAAGGAGSSPNPNRAAAAGCATQVSPTMEPVQVPKAHLLKEAPQ